MVKFADFAEQFVATAGLAPAGQFLLGHVQLVAAEIGHAVDLAGEDGDRLAVAGETRGLKSWSNRFEAGAIIGVCGIGQMFEVGVIRTGGDQVGGHVVAKEIL